MGNGQQERFYVKPKITIAIPAYNNSKTIKASIESALSQEYPAKEILILDDCSKDNTIDIAETYGNKVILVSNDKNMGIGYTLSELMRLCTTKYIIYLCADDVFTSPKVLGDYVYQFDNQPELGVIGRYLYYFMDGKEGAIGVCREKNILLSSCCPSGMAFKKMKQVKIKASNRIFIEMPSIVAQYLTNDWDWTMIEYDTVACRFLPGVNTGTKKEYFTESPWENWVDLIGPSYRAFENFVMIKNRAPKMLWREICAAVESDKRNLLHPKFWFYLIIAVSLPGSVLRSFTNFYRNRITRLTARIIKRKEQYD